mmetsp:Transcript_84589/g.196692  ORF Transcript_84589/g.196692 Transcript_84589/m.196692 type:complete len:83 (-) Transcript_84589:39-287(-)
MNSVGTLFTMLDPLRHLMLDHGHVFVRGHSLGMYDNRTGNLNAVGRFCQVSTILGLSLITIGTLWLLDVPKKIYRACRPMPD